MVKILNIGRTGVAPQKIRPLFNPQRLEHQELVRAILREHRRDRVDVRLHYNLYPIAVGTARVQVRPGQIEVTAQPGGCVGEPGIYALERGDESILREMVTRKLVALLKYYLPRRGVRATVFEIQGEKGPKIMIRGIEGARG